MVRFAAMRPRAICVSQASDVHRVVALALAEVGLDVEHRDALPAEPGDAALVVVDRAARQAAGGALRALAVPVVVVGDQLEDDGLISLMIEAPVSHVVEDPGDRDLGITSQKLATGDLFGLEKYLARGAAVAERAVACDADKRRAMAEVCAWAEGAGARRPTLHRLENVVDELLMNALIDAPQRAGGAARPALLRWGSDDRTLAVSVGDAFGSLRQRDLIDHVRRARDERGRPAAATRTAPGAGLGLYLVLANVASLVVNLDPGRRTEIVALFDRPRTAARAIARGARALHVFHAAP